AVPLHAAQEHVHHGACRPVVVGRLLGVPAVDPRQPQPQAREHQFYGTTPPQATWGSTSTRSPPFSWPSRTMRATCSKRRPTARICSGAAKREERWISSTSTFTPSGRRREGFRR